jgi:hypothetical protein
MHNKFALLNVGERDSCGGHKFNAYAVPCLLANLDLHIELVGCRCETHGLFPGCVRFCWRVQRRLPQASLQIYCSVRVEMTYGTNGGEEDHV